MRHQGPWARQEEGFPRRRPRHPGRLFLRFVFTFGFLALFFFGGMWAVARFLTQLAGGDGSMSVLVWLTGLGLALSFPALAITFAIRAFRGFAEPLSDLMAATDAVAEGDLSVRVAERGQGDFRRMIHSFNRMTEELDLADQRRRNLTADVAHELRTPLQIIQGNLEGVIDGVYAPTDAHIEATLDETRSLARLIEDLRILSLAEAGQLPMIWEEIKLGELLADVRTSFSGQAEAAGVALHIHEEARLSITGDYGRLNQVLTNLVANALRHTPAGGRITLGVAAIPDGVRLTVADSGAGIPAEQIPFLFDRFWRGDPARTRPQPHATGGSGLGLAITKQLVQMHGGRIQVASEMGAGTTFSIALPAVPPVRA
jgi:two-component system OmpR family sensor kinase/two-component system sensor histidine kinase BaeS